MNSLGMRNKKVEKNAIAGTLLHKEQLSSQNTSERRSKTYAKAKEVQRKEFIYFVISYF